MRQATLPRSKRVLAAVAFGLLCFAVLFPAWTLTIRFRSRMFVDLSDVPERPVALVFGAGYWADGTPSDVLRDRIDAAIELQRAGRVSKVIFSGDNRFADYNEPGAMRDYAASRGLPLEAMVLDYAGRRTYDSCYRARDVFGVRSVILVTQRYHLPRALYIAEGLGLDAVGFIADRRTYVFHRWYGLREVPALWASWLDLWIRHPRPVLGDPIPLTLFGESLRCATIGDAPTGLKHGPTACAAWHQPAIIGATT